MSEEAMLLAAVRDVAQLAARVALARFRRGIAVETKPDGSPVTAADVAAEKAAREWIAARFPGDTVVGEELGTGVPDVSGRTWYLDPIDGTRSFVTGVPLWGTMIAVARGNEVLAGAICCPAADELVWAARGEGCWWNDARARVSDVSDISRAVVLTTDDRFVRNPGCGAGWRALAARAGTARTWGDCFGYVLVATGRAEVMLDAVLHDWDSAPLAPIIQEAGGVFTDWSGRSTAFGGSGVATNSALAREARALLAGPA
jgi:histidinol phosphatase-like enzyme (inositol monophosphatase family)